MTTRTTKKGQLVAVDLLALTPVEEAVKRVLIEKYNAAKGNISLTARSMGLSRPTTLKLIRRHGLYGKFRHEPGGIKKGT